MEWSVPCQYLPSVGPVLHFEEKLESVRICHGREQWRIRRLGYARWPGSDCPYGTKPRSPVPTIRLLTVGV